MTETLVLQKFTLAVSGGDRFLADASSDPEESRWIARAKSGDDMAYRWLLDRYRMRVMRLAFSVLQRGSEAEDVAQETFVRAFQGIRHYHDTGQFAGWLFKIVVRLCYDRQRKTSWRGETNIVDEPALPDPADETNSRLLVSALLDQLSPPMRAALTLREMEGLEYEEIAAVLEIPVGTVRSRVNAARARFRQLWNAVNEETQNV